MKELSFTDWKNAASMAIDLIKKGLTVDEQKKVIDLIESAIDLKGVIIDLKEQVISLREENAILKEEARTKESFQHDGQVYWKVLGSNREGPYCPGCWGSKKIQIHMTVDSHDYLCPVCKYISHHTPYPPMPPMYYDPLA